MANQKLNEVTTVPTASINNVKTFLAVMNDGSIQQMSKADMATVLGELTKPLIFDGKILANVDANNITTTGIYLLTDGITNAYIWGFLLCLEVSDLYILQMNFGVDGSNMRIRTKNGDKWNQWRFIGG